MALRARVVRRRADLVGGAALAWCGREIASAWGRPWPEQASRGLWQAGDPPSAQGSVEAELGQLGPARVGLGLVVVVRRRRCSDPRRRRDTGRRSRAGRGAAPAAPGRARRAPRRAGRGRRRSHVGRLELLPLARLGDLAGVDLEGRRRPAPGSACTDPPASPRSAAAARSRSPVVREMSRRDRHQRRRRPRSARRRARTARSPRRARAGGPRRRCRRRPPRSKLSVADRHDVELRARRTVGVQRRLSDHVRRVATGFAATVSPRSTTDLVIGAYPLDADDVAMLAGSASRGSSTSSRTRSTGPASASRGRRRAARRRDRGAAASPTPTTATCPPELLEAAVEHGHAAGSTRAPRLRALPRRLAALGGGGGRRGRGPRGLDIDDALASSRRASRRPIPCPTSARTCSAGGTSAAVR